MNLEQVCPKCGSMLIYDANLDSYFCSLCNEYYYASEFEKHEDNQFTGLYMEIKCKMCNKNTIVSKKFNYGICPFCYNNLIDIIDGVYEFKPKFILKFQDTKENFLKHFFSNAKSQGVPNEILANINLESIKGVYIPFYLYTIENSADCFMQTKESGGRRAADDYYFQKLSYTDESDVLIDATKLLSNDLVNELCDFNFKDVDMFFAKHLGDFFALQPTHSDITAWAELGKIVKAHTEREMEKFKDKNEDIKEVRAFNKIKNISRKMVLLPFWIFDYNSYGETHYLYINGQTLKMASDMHFESNRKVKKGLFGPKIEEADEQVRVIYRDKVKHIEYRTNLEYMNELNKYAVNKNDRSAEIRKVR